MCWRACVCVCVCMCVYMYSHMCFFWVMIYREKVETGKPLTDQFHPRDPHRSKY